MRCFLFITEVYTKTKIKIKTANYIPICMRNLCYCNKPDDVFDTDMYLKARNVVWLSGVKSGVAPNNGLNMHDLSEVGVLMMT